MRNQIDIDIDDLPFSDNEKEVAQFAQQRLYKAVTEGRRERHIQLSNEIQTRKSKGDENSSLNDEPITDLNRCTPYDVDTSTPIDETSENTKFAGMPRIDMYKIDDVLRQIKDNRTGHDSDLGNWLNSLTVSQSMDGYFVIATNESVDKLREIIDEFPNFRTVTQAIIGAAQLSLLAQKPVRLPKLLLNGAPGIGKTEYVRSICTALNIPLIVIPLGSIDGRFELVGGHRTYRSAEPGILIKSFLQHHIANAVFLFDEAELGKMDLYQPLYQFIEDKYFQDHFLEVEFLVEHVNIVLITNDASQLPEAVRSRVHEIEIQKPTKEQKAEIIERIYRNLRKTRTEYAPFGEELDPRCRERLISLSLRQVRISLETAMLMSAASAEKGKFIVNPEFITTQKSEKNPIGFIH